MNKKTEVLKNTTLAIATGLFTGGIVAQIISNGFSRGILLKAYIPALVFYELYVFLNIDNEIIKRNFFILIINILLVVLFVFYCIYD